MASALQQQLAVIAANTTHQLDLRAQRTLHSQSLLFEPKEAANQTFDGIYQIALDGFEELCMLDSRYVLFSQNLFSEQSRSEDRTQMTAAENEELDSVIRSFLGLVSGRLLLSPGQRAIEWLVRRFRAHEHNTEDFVLAFLPHHDNPIFATALSIIPKSRPLSPALKFLQPYIKSLTCPPRHAVLYSAINNPSFFAILNRFVLDAARQRHHSASLLGFWASIMAQTINGQLDSSQSGRPEIKRQREEEVLLRVIPILQEAAQTEGVHELFFGVCMILIILVTKISLKDDVLDALMDTVALGWTKHTLSDALACLSVIIQEKQSPRLPKTTSKKLLRVIDSFDKLEQLSSKFSIDRIAKSLTLAWLKADAASQKIHGNLFARCIGSQAISTETKHDLTVSIIAELQSRSDDGVGSAVGRPLRDVCRETFELAGARSILCSLIGQKRLNAEDVQDLLQEPLPIMLVNEAPVGDEEDGDTVTDESLMAPHGKHANVSLSSMWQNLDCGTTYLSTEQNGEYQSRMKLLAGIAQGNKDVIVAPDSFSPAVLNSMRLSFLLRASSVPDGGTTRLALRMLKEAVKHRQNELADPQALLPYMVEVLQHQDDRCRQLGAAIMKDILSIYKAADKSKKLSDMAILGKDDLYQHSGKLVNWLETSDVYSIMKEAIKDNLHECLLDRGAIGRVLVSAIDGSDDEIELKTSVRAGLFNYLLSHAVQTPALRVRMGLLSILSAVEKTASAGKKQILLPAIRSWVIISDIERDQISRGDNISTSDLDMAYINALTGDDEEEINLIRSAVLGEMSCSPKIVDLFAKRLRKIWPSLGDRAQSHIAKAFLDASLERSTEGADQHDHGGDALVILRSVRLSADALITLLQSVHALNNTPDENPSVKRRRVSASRTRGVDLNQEDLARSIRRLTIVLELVNSSKPGKHPELLKHLFHAFGDLQQMRTYLGSDLVYLQQMILDSILAMVNTLKDTPISRIDRSALRTDLVVDCMRSTSSSQVHNSALLLIAALASWAPDLVLHSVMPIFTFMSSTILRQGDDLSAHIIDQTVSQVVPPLVTSLRKKNQDLVTGAAELLLSFIAAFEHMPMHRRLQLFKQLILALGPDEALSAVIAMLVEKYHSDLRVPGFCMELSGQFDAVTQIRAVVQYIDLVADAMQPRRTVSEAIFNLDQMSADDILAKVEQMIESLAGFLRNGPLQTEVRDSLEHSKIDRIVIESATAAAIDRVVGFSKSFGANAELRSASSSVVTAIINLLPTANFVEAAISLLETPDQSLAVRILTTIEQRITASRHSDTQSRAAFLRALPILTSLLEKTAIEEVQHGSVICIEKITDKYGKKNPTEVLAAAKVVASSAGLTNKSLDIRIIALLTLATMVDTLTERILPILPNVLEQSLQQLQLSVSQEPSAALCDAAASLLTTVLEHLPYLITKAIMSRIIHCFIDAAAHPELSISTRTTRESFVGLAATTVDVRANLNAVKASVDKAFSRSLDGCEELLSVVDKIVSATNKSALVKQSTTILAILKDMFDVRDRLASVSDEPDSNGAELEALDTLRNDTMMKTVLKLNDAAFRPFFVDLAEWAFTDSSEASRGRQLSLYGFLATFFDSLKSLVTSYASYFLNHACDMLKNITTSDQDETALLARITAALRASFVHDQDDFWAAPSHFSAIRAALIDRLKKARSIAKEDPIDLVSTVVELASAASSPDHLKELNGELLKMMRARQTYVRMAAVKTQRSLTERLGEDWLDMLPEMLPVISEVQEDEDEEVEREVAAWIKGIEGVLGESLEGMLQ